MNEEVYIRLAALNAIWQRYASVADEPLDLATADALNRDYLAAWRGLDACGIAEWMLVYDPTTLTFSLATADTITDDDFATRPLPAITARNRWRKADPGDEQMPLI